MNPHVSNRHVILHQHGGPEVMALAEHELPPPDPHEVQIRQFAIGLNFIDLYHRSGLYPLALPCGLGLEAAGVIEAVGAEVQHWHVGERVAYAGGTPGAYTQYRNLATSQLVRLPASLSFEHASATLLKGLTAWYLLHQTHRIVPGETIVFHAAAGGVGLIACQWARALGARVIGTVSTPAKAEWARQHGCQHVVIQQPGWSEEVLALNHGQGVPVVYDSVGQDTWEESLRVLAPRGLMVSFGNASGAPPAIAPGRLADLGSIYLTRPTLKHYVGTAEALHQASTALFDAMIRGQITPVLQARWPLEQVQAAHASMAARQTIGASILLP